MRKLKLLNPRFIFKLAFALILALTPVLVLAADVSQSLPAKTNCEKFQKKFEVIINGKPVNLMTGEPFYCTFSELILKIIDYLLVVSGTVAILFLMVGGFWYLTSAGGEEQAEKGKKTIINAVIGLVVILLAFAIVRVVSSTLSLGK
jgi:hypothetical protein